MALPRRRTPVPNPDVQVRNVGASTDWHALYKIKNQADVDAFIAKNPHIVPVLTRAFSEIAARFGGDVELLLEHKVDPEDEPASEYLSVGIRTSLDGEEAYARRRRLDHEWWLDAVRDVGADLTIDIAHR